MRRLPQPLLTLLCFSLGFLLTIQWRSWNEQHLEAYTTDRAQIISRLVQVNADLRQEVERLESALEQAQEYGNTPSLEWWVQELNTLRALNGSAEVTGPGVEIIIEGPIASVHLLDLINELRNAGSEAIAINEERVTLTTAIATDTEGHPIINGSVVTGPYRIRAIGDADVIATALARPGGLLNILQRQNPDWHITINMRETLRLPKRRDIHPPTYARLTEE